MNTNSIDISDLAPGLYFIRGLAKDGGQCNARFIKQ
jgi:hypothetical protein